MARPVLPWRSPLIALPLDGKDVYIRRLPWYDQPTLCHFWRPGTFSVLVPVYPPTEDPLQIDVPASEVHSWKFRYLADEQAAFPPT